VAQRIAPSHHLADDASGSTAATCIDWHGVSGFHVGMGRAEPTSDAGYATAGTIQQPNTLISLLALRGVVHIRPVRPLFALQVRVMVIFSLDRGDQKATSE
jgi:hypothetical protein